MLLNESLHIMSALTATTSPLAPDLATTMSTSVDYQTRRRLQNRISQQRFRKKSKKQGHSDAAQPDCYSSSSLPKYSSEGQMAISAALLP
ncbi:hypothetical protein BDW75DRAFT_197555 [Aspergillus navahoensis]